MMMSDAMFDLTCRVLTPPERFHPNDRVEDWARSPARSGTVISRDRGRFDPAYHVRFDHGAGVYSIAAVYLRKIP